MGIEPKYYYVHELPQNPDQGAFYVITGTEQDHDGNVHEFIEIWAWDSVNESWVLCDKQYPEMEMERRKYD